jgi:hypothetical protein
MNECQEFPALTLRADITFRFNTLDILPKILYFALAERTIRICAGKGIMNIKIIVLAGFAVVFLIIITANNDDDQYALPSSSSENASTVARQTDLPVVMPESAKTPSVETKSAPAPEPTSKPEPAPVVVTRVANPQPMPLQQVPTETVCFFIPTGVQFNGSPPEALRTNCTTGKPLYPVAFDQAIRALQRQQEMRQQQRAAQQAQQQAAADGPVFVGGVLDGIPNLSPDPYGAQSAYEQENSARADRAQERALGDIRRQGIHDCRKACIRDATNVNLCTASCGNY